MAVEQWQGLPDARQSHFAGRYGKPKAAPIAAIKNTREKKARSKDQPMTGGAGFKNYGEARAY